MKLHMITIDCADATTLSRWWADALGGEVLEENDGWFCIVKIPDWPMNLGFQKVEHPTPGKNRAHLDLGGDNSAEQVSRLVAAGATVIDTHSMGDYSWTVLADPEENQFCVA